MVREQYERLLKQPIAQNVEGFDVKNIARILVVDDHAMIRQGLTALIEPQKDMVVVEEADSGKSACQKARRLLPDVVVMDISMEEGTGIQATEQMKRECPQVKVVIFTIHEDRGYLQELFQVGASGYILKSSPAEEVLKAIRSTLKGGTYVDPRLGDSLLDLLRRPAQEAAPRVVALSEREQMVLKQVARGYVSKEIAVQLGISIKTVETHRTRAMNKLGLDSRVDLVRYAVGQGWFTES